VGEMSWCVSVGLPAPVLAHIISVYMPQFHALLQDYLYFALAYCRQAMCL